MKHLTWLLLLVAACSSDDPAAPSRTPIPVPNPAVDSGATGDGGTSDCFDASATKPTEKGQFLNQCNSAECFKFDNATRIEGFTPGAPLPPLN